MLELKNKWFTNSLAKESILKKDFIACENGVRLFIVGYGNLTSSGKNTYNYELKDEQGTILASGNDAYLDKLTTLIKGTSPKAKEGAKEGKSAKDNKNLVSEYLRLEANLKKAILAFSDFQTLHNITTLQDVKTLQTQKQREKRNEHQQTRRDEINILKRLQTLRKWAKETKRLDLLQALNDKLLSIM